MIHTDIEFDGARGQVRVRIHPTPGDDAETTDVVISRGTKSLTLDLDEFEHIHRLAQAYRAAQAAAVKALE